MLGPATNADKTFSPRRRRRRPNAKTDRDNAVSFFSCFFLPLGMPGSKLPGKCQLSSFPLAIDFRFRGLAIVAPFRFSCGSPLMIRG